MKTIITRVFMALSLCLIAAFSSSAQTTAPASNAVSTASAASAGTQTYPQYFVSFGGGYMRNATPQAASGFISAAVGIGGGMYSITTVDMTSTANTIRTGFAKIFSQSGNFTLLGRIDAGISTVTPVIGSFSGGAIVMYDLGGISSKFKGQNMYVFAEARIMGASTTTTAQPNQVTPGFYVGIGKSF